MLNSRQGRRGRSKAPSPLPVATRWEHPRQTPRYPVRSGSERPAETKAIPWAERHPAGYGRTFSHRHIAASIVPPAPGIPSGPGATVDAPTGPCGDLRVNHSPLAPNAGAPTPQTSNPNSERRDSNETTPVSPAPSRRPHSWQQRPGGLHAHTSTPRFQSI